MRLYGSFGSNKVMAGELSRLVRRATTDCRLPDALRHGPSSVSYPFEAEAAAVAMRYHRTSARVLWELVQSPAARLENLYEDLRQWRSGTELHLPSTVAFSVATHGVGDFPAGERQVLGTVKNALIDGAAQRGQDWILSPEHPELLIDVRYAEGSTHVSVDLAGRPMHQRGYRHQSGEAPLREDVAAMLVMLARHNPRLEALVDPMAGSGTIGIEAASMAMARYNWCSGRGPLGASLPDLRPFFAERAKPLFEDTEPCVLLGDQDPVLVALQSRNAATAGIAEHVTAVATTFQEWDPAEVQARVAAAGLSRGLILSNPPYGERLASEQDLSLLYADLGRWCRCFPGWRAAFIVSNPAFESAFGARARVKKPLRNGQLKATFYLFEL